MTDQTTTTAWKESFDDLPGYYRGETGVRVDDGQAIDMVARWNVSGNGGQSYSVALALPPEVARAKARALLDAAEEVDPTDTPAAQPWHKLHADAYVMRDLTYSDRPSAYYPDTRERRLNGPIHGWFGLSYANYLVAPRARLQSMPVAWQERMVACLEELDAAFDHLDQGQPIGTGYNVQTGQWVYVGELDERSMKAAGVTSEEHPEAEDNQQYYDRDGNQLDPHERVFVPDLVDPNPHYNRGRTYLAPFGEDTTGGTP